MNNRIDYRPFYRLEPFISSQSASKQYSDPNAKQKETNLKNPVIIYHLSFIIIIHHYTKIVPSTMQPYHPKHPNGNHQV